MSNTSIKTIVIDETLGVSRKEEPVSFGLPFEKGILRDLRALRLYGETGIEIPLQATSLELWADNSFKWVLLDFQATIEADSQEKLKLVLNDQEELSHGIAIKEDQDVLIIDTGKVQFYLNKQLYSPFSKVISSNGNSLRDVSSKCFLVFERKEIVPTVEKIVIEHRGPIRATILIEGSFQVKRKRKMTFISRVHFFYKKSLIKIDFTLRNPNSSYHPGGIWDLGDKGSICFKALFFEVLFPQSLQNEIKYTLQKDEPLRTSKKNQLLIFQESSGGENWNCSNHLNRNGKVPLRFRGFEVREDNAQTIHGNRATPVLWAGDARTGISVALPLFWQNFPKALEASTNSLRIGLFPKHSEDLHELQGGEQKTETTYLDVCSNTSDLLWVREPLIPFIKPDAYETTRAVPNFHSDQVNTHNEYQQLIETAIYGENSFFKKREKIDEYGWRNFGEVYADHEATRSDEKNVFISHYNNQYDLIYGAYRQFIASSDLHWYKIMTQLATHVRDIDIYHTDEDREEYNHGLFWHTNHYFDAGTSTHRSFSRAHLKEVDSRFYGGGPAPEHCYTTGLKYHYYLTGDIPSKDVVIALTNSCIKALSPPTTIIECLLKIKKLILLKGADIKSEEVFSWRYPFNRGTGNAIVACLDAYDLSKNRWYLEKAEIFIKNCVHPSDDITSRQLLDAEKNWSYTVFLTALGGYLDKKIEIGEIDGMYEYARRCLTRYAQWMIDYEYPYLEKPEALEFPTETWAAQEMRKSCVFYYAAKHSGGAERKSYLEKGKFFFETSVKSLQSFSTKHLTRPIVLLLQNGWVWPCLHKGEGLSHLKVAENTRDMSPSNAIDDASGCNSLWRDLLEVSKQTSFKKEFHWIKSRIRSIQVGKA